MSFVPLNMFSSLYTLNIMITYDSIKQIINNTKGLINRHDETRLLFDLASNLKSGLNILEIGSYCGLSSTCLAYGAQNSGNNLYCITQWQDDISIEWRKNIQQNQINATVIYGDANIVLKDININRLGLVFIDAHHIYDDVKTQFNAIIPYLADKAIVAFHDYGRQYIDVTRYCNEIIAANHFINHRLVHCTLYGNVPTHNSLMR